MSVCAVISEFNPFHNGHKYLIDAIKANGADAVVCVMSGNAVQRGELAMCDKYYRAEAALKCGVDLVIELPFPWCASGAESFARCGVYVASEVADKICFGSECGDVSLLKRAADTCLEESFKEEYKNRLQGDAGAAEVYFELLEELSGIKLSSNDILGTEYLKAARLMGLEVDFQTFTRVASSYSDVNLRSGNIQSATAVRRKAYELGVDAVSEYLPIESFNLLKNADIKGEIAVASRIERAILLFFRTANPKSLESIADLDRGLAERICRMAREGGETPLIERLRTKRYTDARLRRAILFCMTGVTREDIAALPEYVNLLAANETGRGILSKNKKTMSVSVLAKAADTPKTTGAERQRELSGRLDSIYTLSLDTPADAYGMMKKSPIII